MSGESALAYLRLCTALSRFRATPAELDERQRRALDLQVARAQSIRQRLLQAPEALQVVLPRTVVEEGFSTIARRYASRQEFRDDLLRNGLDEAALRAGLEEELRAEAVAALLASPHIEVSDAEAEIFYLSHPSSFTRPESRAARHILITVNPDYAENRRGRSRERLEAIARELGGDGNRFDALARRYSECPSALEGGRLGQVRRGSLYPRLEEALFRLPEGGISDIVESELGFHLLWCERIGPARRIPFTEARQQIVTHLSERKKRLFLKQWLDHGS